MSSRSLYRLAAAALVLSGISLALGLLLHPMPPYGESVATTQWALSHLFWWLGASAGVVGIAGLYLRRRREVGVLGFWGAAAALLGLVLIASAMYFETLVVPSLARRAPEVFEGFPAGGGWEGFLAGVIASGALFGLGFLLLGARLFRVEGVPGAAVVLALAGGIPVAVNFLLPRPVALLAVAVFAVGLFGLGRSLWRSAVEAPEAIGSV